jgi:hypothetical protein
MLFSKIFLPFALLALQEKRDDSDPKDPLRGLWKPVTFAAKKTPANELSRSSSGTSSSPDRLRSGVFGLQSDGDGLLVHTRRMIFVVLSRPSSSKTFKIRARIPADLERNSSAPSSISRDSRLGCCLIASRVWAE